MRMPTKYLSNNTPSVTESCLPTIMILMRTNNETITAKLLIQNSMSNTISPISVCQYHLVINSSLLRHLPLSKQERALYLHQLNHPPLKHIERFGWVSKHQTLVLHNSD